MKFWKKNRYYSMQYNLSKEMVKQAYSASKNGMTQFINMKKIHRKIWLRCLIVGAVLNILIWGIVK